jgi:ABC-2 type transport system ATP-binding protein
MLKIQNLTKYYKKFKAVDNISMEISKGEIIGFVGANGAGKTTTMKMIAGLLKPTNGKIFIDGIDLSKRPFEAKNKIGYMPDFFGVYDDLKVLEYLDFYASLHDVPQKNRSTLINELLELVNLTDKKDFFVDNLSRGMKQRLCLARSLIHDPSLLILDEPASGLDPKARVDMKLILKSLKNMGKTILISSHILPELAELCTTILIINDGKIVVKGSVDDVMHKLADTKNMQLKLSSDVSHAKTLLSEFPEVSSITSEDSKINFKFSGNKESTINLLNHLVSNDVKIYWFGDIGHSLEDAFISLMHNELPKESQEVQSNEN